MIPGDFQISRGFFSQVYIEGDDYVFFISVGGPVYTCMYYTIRAHERRIDFLKT